MKTKLMISGLLMAIGLSTAVSAQVMGTPWNGKWLTLSQSATLPAKKGIDGDGMVAANNTLNKTAQKHKSGRCMIYIIDTGADNYYDRVFCNYAADIWEYAGNFAIQTADKASNTIGSHDISIYTPEQGQSIAATTKFMMYQGTLLLTAKLDGTGKIKTVTSSGNRGRFYLGNSADYIFGTTPAGSLKIKLAKTTDITQGLTACLNSVDGGGGLISNCAPDMMGGAD